MRVRIRPMEAVHAVALGVLTALTIALRHRLENPGGLLLVYLVLAGVLVLVTWLVPKEDRLPAPLDFLIDFYPAVFLPVLFNVLEPLIAALRGGARDDLLIAIDRALFGVDVSVWMQRFSRPLVNDIFYCFYASYYFLALTLGLVLWMRNRTTGRRFVFTLMVVYYS